MRDRGGGGGAGGGGDGGGGCCHGHGAGDGVGGGGGGGGDGDSPSSSSTLSSTLTGLAEDLLTLASHRGRGVLVDDVDSGVIVSDVDSGVIVNDINSGVIVNDINSGVIVNDINSGVIVNDINSGVIVNDINSGVIVNDINSAVIVSDVNSGVIVSDVDSGVIVSYVDSGGGGGFVVGTTRLTTTSSVTTTAAARTLPGGERRVAPPLPTTPTTATTTSISLLSPLSLSKTTTRSRKTTTTSITRTSPLPSTTVTSPTTTATVSWTRCCRCCGGVPRPSVAKARAAIRRWTPTVFGYVMLVSLLSANLLPPVWAATRPPSAPHPPPGPREPLPTPPRDAGGGGHGGDGGGVQFNHNLHHQFHQQQQDHYGKEVNSVDNSGGTGEGGSVGGSESGIGQNQGQGHRKGSQDQDRERPGSRTIVITGASSPTVSAASSSSLLLSATSSPSRTAKVQQEPHDGRQGNTGEARFASGHTAAAAAAAIPPPSRSSLPSPQHRNPQHSAAAAAAVKPQPPENSAVVDSATSHAAAVQETTKRERPGMEPSPSSASSSTSYSSSFTSTSSSHQSPVLQGMPQEGGESDRFKAAAGSSSPDLDQVGENISLASFSSISFPPDDSFSQPLTRRETDSRASYDLMQIHQQPLKLQFQSTAWVEDPAYSSQRREEEGEIDSETETIPDGRDTESQSLSRIFEEETNLVQEEDSNSESLPGGHWETEAETKLVPERDPDSQRTSVGAEDDESSSPVSSSSFSSSMALSPSHPKLSVTDTGTSSAALLPPAPPPPMVRRDQCHGWGLHLQRLLRRSTGPHPHRQHASSRRHYQHYPSGPAPSSFTSLASSSSSSSSSSSAYSFSPPSASSSSSSSAGFSAPSSTSSQHDVNSRGLPPAEVPLQVMIHPQESQQQQYQTQHSHYQHQQQQKEQRYRQVGQAPTQRRDIRLQDEVDSASLARGERTGGSRNSGGGGGVGGDVGGGKRRDKAGEEDTPMNADGGRGADADGDSEASASSSSSSTSSDAQCKETEQQHKQLPELCACRTCPPFNHSDPDNAENARCRRSRPLLTDWLTCQICSCQTAQQRINAAISTKLPFCSQFPVNYLLKCTSMPSNPSPRSSSSTNSDDTSDDGGGDNGSDKSSAPCDKVEATSCGDDDDDYGDGNKRKGKYGCLCSKQDCVQDLREVLEQDRLAEERFEEFKGLLGRYDCTSSYSVKWKCEQCEEFQESPNPTCVICLKKISETSAGKVTLTEKGSNSINSVSEELHDTVHSAAGDLVHRTFRISYDQQKQHKDLSIARQHRDHKDIYLIIKYLLDRNPFTGDGALRSISSGKEAEASVNAEQAESVGKLILSSMVGKNVFDVTFKKKDQAVTMAQKTKSTNLNDDIVLHAVVPETGEDCRIHPRLSGGGLCF